MSLSPTPTNPTLYAAVQAMKAEHEAYARAADQRHRETMELLRDLTELIRARNETPTS